MSAATVILSVAAVVFVAGDWWAVARADRRLEYVCKPAATASLLGIAATLHAAPAATQTWFLVALALCLVGDVCLLLPEGQAGHDGFIPGLGAFLLAHVCFTLGFVARGLTTLGVVIGVVVIASVAVPLAVRFVGALRRAGDRALVPPILAYLVAIAATVVTAAGAGNPWGIAGAALFVGSDALIAETRFVGERRGAPVAIMVTYYLALGALVASLA